VEVGFPRAPGRKSDDRDPTVIDAAFGIGEVTD
jgi:hypothetical protein